MAASQRMMTPRAFRARQLEFRSFALLVIEAFVALTGLWWLWPLALVLPVFNVVGLALAVAASRIPERSPRLVAPVLIGVHTLALLFAGYLAWMWWLIAVA